MTLKELKNKHELSSQQIADLLGYTRSSIETYCSIPDTKRSKEAAGRLDNMIKNAYAVAVGVLEDDTAREVVIKQVAYQIIARNFRLNTEMYRVFRILAEIN